MGKFASNRIGMNLTMMCDITNDGTTFEAWVMQQHLKIDLKIGIICLDKLLQCDHGRDVVIKVGLFNDNFHTQLSIPYNGSKHKTSIHTKVYGEFLEFILIFL
jgi:hypothetical protein